MGMGIHRHSGGFCILQAVSLDDRVDIKSLGEGYGMNIMVAFDFNAEEPMDLA